MKAVKQWSVLFAGRARTFFAREGCRAALILVLILNVLFFPCILGHKSMLDSAQLCSSILPGGAAAGQRVPMGWAKTLDGAAAAWFFEPSIALTGDEYLGDRTIPLWNPYQAFGTPLAANMQSQPFCPLTALLALHLTPFTYNLFILSRLFVTGIFAFLFFRIYVSFLPAMAGAIAAMLGGYYILYMTMPHISVDMLIPASLFAAEHLLRARTYRSFLGFTLILFLAIVGGMPESSLLLLAFLYAYIAFRILSDLELRSRWVALITRLLLSGMAGLGLSSLLLIPFLEFMRHSYNTHDPARIGGAIPGLYHFTPDSTILTYLFPLLYGQWHGLANQFGLVALFLSLIALMAIFKSSNGRGPRQLGRLTGFFGLYAILLLLKHYGIRPVNDLGRLPLLRYVDFYKYGEPVLSICVAALCAIGLERILRGQAAKWMFGTALGVSFAMAPLAFYVGQKVMTEEVKAHRAAVQFPEIALTVAVGAIFCLSICTFLFQGLHRRLAVSIAGILLLEFSLNYIVPLYYLYNSLPNRSQNPYAGARYVDFLRQQTPHLERIFARDRELYPDWASVFRLQDVRDLDAMYYTKYLPFVRNFIAAGSPSKTQELWDRFTGDESAYAFQTQIEKRFLQLSSVKYLVSDKPYADPAFQAAYNDEVKIYRYDEILPRAAIYYRAEIESNEAQVLKRLADPTLDVFHTVLLDRTKLKSAEMSDLSGWSQEAGRSADAGEITSYLPQAVEIRASLDRSGILVLNDSDYPGWAVEIDGSPGRWFTANYLFRGVFLHPGRHVVRFVYRPRTFNLGAGIAMATLLLLGAAGAARYRRRRKMPPGRDSIGEAGLIAPMPGAALGERFEEAASRRQTGAH